LSGAASSATKQDYQFYDEVSGKIDAQLQALNRIMSADLKSFNNLVRSSDIPAVIVKPSPAAASSPAGQPGEGDVDEGP
jgi:hypothetical protein